MILFLDDSPERAATIYRRMSDEERDKTIWCSTAAETIQTLWDYKKKLTLVMLDHDLGGETFVNTKREDCGMEVIRWLETTAKKKPSEFEDFKEVKFVVHSWNSHAAPIMVDRMERIGLNAVYQPFGT